MYGYRIKQVFVRARRYDIQPNGIQHNNKKRVTHHIDSFVMLSVVILSVVMLSVVMLSVIMLSVVVLNVSNKPFMLSVIIVNVIKRSVFMLSVEAPQANVFVTDNRKDTSLLGNMSNFCIL